MNTTIAHEQLGRVTGGTTTTPTSRCGGTGGALYGALNSLQSSLASLSNNNNNNGGLNSTTLLCMAMCMSQRHGEAFYGPRGYYYSYW